MCIHGDKSQPERDWVLTGATNTPPQQQILLYLLLLSPVICFLRVFLPAEFRSGKAPILIATDVASRGLGMSCVPAWTAELHPHVTKYTCHKAPAEGGPNPRCTFLKGPILFFTLNLKLEHWCNKKKSRSLSENSPFSPLFTSSCRNCCFSSELFSKILAPTGHLRQWQEFI